MTNHQEQSFSFGKNWQEFLKSIDKDRISIAEESLIEFTQLQDFKNKTFIDVGCGSGLFSLAAHNLHAKRIVSFDIDPFSVQCCEMLRKQTGSPDNWEVFRGSALDEGFLTDLGSFDIVYSWGVLHHTGQMWRAIEHTMKMTKPGGLLYIAIYNKILNRRQETSWVHDFWIKVKKQYNQRPVLGKFVLEPMAMAAYIAIVMARLENPVTHIKNYKSHRGMSWRRDATDWIGGYPYEFATVEEVFKFIRTVDRGFNLTNLKVTSGRGLNWYLFERSGRMI